MALLSVALAAALSTHAAAPRASAKAAASLWAAPIGRSMLMIGGERLAGTGRPSLETLSRRLLEAGSAAAVGRLAAALSEMTTPQEFAAKTTAEQLDLLRAAAARAETEAAREADAFLATAYDDELDDAAVKALREKLAALAADAPYFTQEINERLDRLAGRLNHYESGKKAALERWRSELPLKVHEGGFGADTIAFDGRSWRIADHPPTWRGYPTFQAAFESRVKDLAQARPPWKAELLQALSAAVSARRDAGELAPEAAEGMQARIDALKGAEASRSLDESLARPGEPMTARRLRGLLKRYEEFAYGSGPVQSVYAADVLNRGRPALGYPSFWDLETERRNIIAHHHRHALRAMWSIIGGISAFTLASVLNVPPQGQGWPLILAIAAMVAAFGYFFYHSWQRDELGFDTTYLIRRAADEQRRAVEAASKKG